MSPRHLGGLHITLAQQQEATHIHMRTENSVAAQMLVDAEVRLAQMLKIPAETGNVYQFLRRTWWAGRSAK